MEYEEINETIAEATQCSKWSVAELDESLLQIKDNTLDDTLRIIRMKKAIYSFPVPEEEKDVYAGIQLFFARCEKKKAGLFAGKSSKLDNGINYINTTEICDSHQHLYRGDGVHFKPDFYPIWARTILKEILKHEN